MTQIVEMARQTTGRLDKGKPDRDYNWVCHCQTCAMVRSQAREESLSYRSERDDRTNSTQIGSSLDLPPGPSRATTRWHGTTNEQAEEMLELFVRSVVLGGTSPSRPVTILDRVSFDAAWKRVLDATVEHYWTAGTHVRIEQGQA